MGRDNLVHLSVLRHLRPASVTQIGKGAAEAINEAVRVRAIRILNLLRASTNALRKTRIDDACFKHAKLHAKSTTHVPFTLAQWDRFIRDFFGSAYQLGHETTVRVVCIIRDFVKELLVAAAEYMVVGQERRITEKHVQYPILQSSTY